MSVFFLQYCVNTPLPLLLYLQGGTNNYKLVSCSPSTLQTSSDAYSAGSCSSTSSSSSSLDSSAAELLGLGYAHHQYLASHPWGSFLSTSNDQPGTLFSLAAIGAPIPSSAPGAPRPGMAGRTEMYQVFYNAGNPNVHAKLVYKAAKAPGSNEVVSLHCL